MTRLFIAIFLVLSIQSFGQRHRDKPSLGVGYQHVNFEKFAVKHAIGINWEVMMNKRIGVELSLAGGDGYFDYGIASCFAPPLILMERLTRKKDGNYETNGTIGIFIIFLTIPAILEQTNFHIRITDNIHIIPFISVYKFKYLNDRNPGNPYQYFSSGSIGTRFSLITRKRWSVSANYRLLRLYRGSEFLGELDHSVNKVGHEWGLNVGFAGIR
jgi:hypothetical protein